MDISAPPYWNDMKVICDNFRLRNAQARLEAFCIQKVDVLMFPGWASTNSDKNITEKVVETLGIKNRRTTRNPSTIKSEALEMMLQS